ncbi:hypothetical protein SAMN05216548_12611 [Faunimonas pinastri]|uniref:Uncharacterized protein n=1 Tax=Faunimonas pinastri TaxID=1855383 RepID=A0A1H9Q910_9HYPH|nr:hypothetical protein [Faunimonas pinastri]SER56907.1 hypothetical protein SAMN05216548_12611 [Faunimonas pinastri]
MRNTLLKEAVSVLGSVLDALRASITATGEDAADLHYAIGDLSASASARLISGAAADDLSNCFDLATAAGATLDTMRTVRETVQDMSPSGKPGLIVQTFSVRLALVQEAAILFASTLSSRDEVESLQDRFNTAFEAAENTAADAMETETYRTLVELHAAVTRFLSTLSYTLPRIVKVTYPKSFPALTLAQRLYQDAGRASELIAENKPMHPAFMPAALRALSE